MLTIVPMPNDDSVIETVARWNSDFWKDQGVTLESQIQDYKHLLQAGGKTFALIAYWNDELAGSICVEKQGDKYLGAGLFVPKEMRKYKIGDALVEAMKSHAAKLGVDKLYAWTPNLTRWYKQHGFVVIKEQTEHLGMLVDVLVVDTKGE